MTSDKPARRGSHIEMPVAYAAVGASKLPDITRFPPEGSTPFEEAVRLGSGQPRFLTASNLLMTWGAQRGAGVMVEELGGGDDDGYTGPEFGVDGTPEAPAAREEQFAPDGTPYLTAGLRARMTPQGRSSRDVLVIYTINEPNRVGFAWGTVDAEGAIGEQLFLVEHRDDDSVWAVGRGFLEATRGGLFGIKGRGDVQAAIDAITAQLRALHPGGNAEAN